MSTNQGRKYVGGKPVKAIQEKPLGKYEQSSEDKAESVWWAEKYGYGVGKMMPVNFGGIAFELVQAWRSTKVEGRKSWQVGERATPAQAAFEKQCAALNVHRDMMDEICERVHRAAACDGVALNSTTIGQRNRDLRGESPKSKHRNAGLVEFDRLVGGGKLKKTARAEAIEFIAHQWPEDDCVDNRGFAAWLTKRRRFALKKLTEALAMGNKSGTAAAEWASTAMKEEYGAAALPAATIVQLALDRTKGNGKRE